MNNKQLLRAIGQIDDAFIQEAEPDALTLAQPVEVAPKPPAKISSRWRWALIGLVVVLSATVSGLLLHQGATTATPPPEPPTAAPTPGASPARPPLALSIGEATGALTEARSLAVFGVPLTPDQLAAFLPGLTLPLEGDALYTPEGRLALISTTQIGPPDGVQDPALCGQGYVCTRIEFAPGDSVPACVIIESGQAETTEIDGIAVSSFRFAGTGKAIYYQSDFALGAVTYRVSLYDLDPDSGAARLSQIVEDIIAGGPADLSSIDPIEFPDLRHDLLTLDQARHDPTFGAYVPKGELPATFGFESARRTHFPTENSLSVWWSQGAVQQSGYFEVSIGTADLAHDLQARLVHPDEPQKYDMSRYPIPWAESIPDELWEVVQNPVFRAEELSVDVVEARLLATDEPGEEADLATFAVLYDGIIVQVSARGLTADQIWDLIADLG